MDRVEFMSGDLLRFMAIRRCVPQGGCEDYRDLQRDYRNRSRRRSEETRSLGRIGAQPAVPLG